MAPTDTQELDAIVVGAGPAGTAAAYDIAAAGLSVLILDRKLFPRQKPCAGALTIKAIKRLRYSIAPVIRFVARDLDIGFGSAARRLRSDWPIAVMTVRAEFDAFCLAQTIRRGALFRRIRDLAALTADTEGVTVRTTDGEPIRARFVIGADGASSRVRRLMGIGKVPQTLALEGCVASTRKLPNARMRFDFGYVPGGYGWVFPKGDHLNIGLYTQRPSTTVTKSALITYARAVLDTDAISNIVGHPIGVGGETYRPQTARVLLAGDAAGMAERLLGEGIHNAIKSGQAAAETVLTALGTRGSNRKPYDLRLRELRSDLAACSTAARWFYGMPQLGFGALASFPGRTALMRGFAAGKTLREIMQSFAFAPFYRIDGVRSIIQLDCTRQIVP